MKRNALALGLGLLLAAIEAELTVVGGKIVYGAGAFADHAPPLPEILPAWSPVAVFGGYGAPLRDAALP